MFGESGNFGFIPTAVIDLRAGNLYNVAISLLVFIVCFYAAWTIFFRAKRSLTEGAFAAFLFFVSINWLVIAVGNLFAWFNILPNLSAIAFVIKFISILPLVALAYFLAGEAFENRTSVRRITLIAALIGLAYFITTVNQDQTMNLVTYWGVQWQISPLSFMIYGFGLLFPLGFLAIYLVFNGALTRLIEKQTRNLTLYFSAIIYVLLEYIQFSSNAVTWQRLLARLLYILIAFGAYLFFSGRTRETRLIPRDQPIPLTRRLRIPFFLRLLLLFVLLALVPITIASLLMFISFKEIIDLYIYKPLLWNLKSSREAFLMALDHVQVQALFLTLLTAILVFVTSLMVSRSIARSLRNVSSGMARVSQGDFSFKLLPDSNDEIGDVIGYFNDMSAEIKRSRELMERWNKELETKVAERTQDLRTLYNVSKAIGSSLDLELLIGRALEQLLPIMQADFHALLVPEEEKRFSVRLANKFNLKEITLSEENGLLLEAVTKNEIVYSENVPVDPRCRGECFKQIAAKTLVITPLRAKGKTLGILVMGTHGSHTYSKEREINLLATISDQLAIAIENVDIYEKQKEAVARLTELDRMKNEFISMVSHELRTPITSIDGYVSLFLAGALGPLAEDQKKQLGIIRENDQRLLGLINRLLDFSSMEMGRFSIKRELVSIHAVIQSAVETLKPQIEKKKAGVNLKLSAQNMNFMGDRDKTGEVIINLIENALKFGKEGEPLMIEIVTRDADNFIQVEVADNGLGIEKEHLEKIFNKFYQVEETLTRRAGGVGLGLAIVKEIVGNHQGKIWAESEGKGKGSRFIFTLPVAEKK